MIDGMAVTDAHMHVPRLSTVSPAWMKWAEDYGRDSPWRTVFGPDGDPLPARLDALLQAEGVDTALLFAEYSPRTTGIQPAEDAARQLAMGAVAVKLHPVHGAFRPDAQALYPVYDLCAERNFPVIVHT